MAAQARVCIVTRARAVAARAARAQGAQAPPFSRRADTSAALAKALPSSAPGRRFGRVSAKQLRTQLRSHPDERVRHGAAGTRPAPRQERCTDRPAAGRVTETEAPPSHCFQSTCLSTALKLLDLVCLLAEQTEQKNSSVGRAPRLNGRSARHGFPGSFSGSRRRRTVLETASGATGGRSRGSSCRARQAGAQRGAARLSAIPSPPHHRGWHAQLIWLAPPSPALSLGAESCAHAQVRAIPTGSRARARGAMDRVQAGHRGRTYGWRRRRMST